MTIETLPANQPETFYRGAGLPHAIGDGILLVEVQEPTDFSVLLEHFGVADGHLGLGYDLALRCVDRGAWTPARLAGLRGTDRLLPAAATAWGRASASSWWWPATAG